MQSTAKVLHKALTWLQCFKNQNMDCDMDDNNGIGSELIDLLLGDQLEVSNTKTASLGNENLVGHFTQLNKASDINNGIWGEIIGVDRERDEYQLKLPDGSFARTGVHLAKDIRDEAPKSAPDNPIQKRTVGAKVEATQLSSLPKNQTLAEPEQDEDVVYRSNPKNQFASNVDYAFVMNMQGRMTHEKLMDAPDDWIVMNASRPLVGDMYSEGDFLAGRFYVAIDPKSEYAVQNVDQNNKLDARVVIYASKKQQNDAVLFGEKYAAEYREDAETIDDLYNNLSVKHESFRDKTVSEILAALRNGAGIAPPEMPWSQSTVSKTIQDSQYPDEPDTNSSEKEGPKIGDLTAVDEPLKHIMINARIEELTQHPEVSIHQIETLRSLFSSNHPLNAGIISNGVKFELTGEAPYWDKDLSDVVLPCFEKKLAGGDRQAIQVGLKTSAQTPRLDTENSIKHALDCINKGELDNSLPNMRWYLDNIDEAFSAGSFKLNDEAIGGVEENTAIHFDQASDRYGLKKTAINVQKIEVLIDEVTDPDVFDKALSRFWNEIEELDHGSFHQELRVKAVSKLESISNIAGISLQQNELNIELEKAAKKSSSWTAYNDSKRLLKLDLPQDWLNAGTVIRWDGIDKECLAVKPIAQSEGPNSFLVIEFYDNNNQFEVKAIENELPIEFIKRVEAWNLRPLKTDSMYFGVKKDNVEKIKRNYARVIELKVGEKIFLPSYPEFDGMLTGKVDLPFNGEYVYLATGEKVTPAEIIGIPESDLNQVLGMNKSSLELTKDKSPAPHDSWENDLNKARAYAKELGLTTDDSKAVWTDAEKLTQHIQGHLTEKAIQKSMSIVDTNSSPVEGLLEDTAANDLMDFLTGKTEELPAPKDESIKSAKNTGAIEYERDPEKAFLKVQEEFGSALKDYRSERALTIGDYYISSGENNQRYTLRLMGSGHISNLTESAEYALRSALKLTNGKPVYFNTKMELGVIERNKPVKSKKGKVKDIELTDADELAFLSGVHEGKKPSEVVLEDRNYLEWISAQHFMKKKPLLKAYINRALENTPDPDLVLPSSFDFKYVVANLEKQGVTLQQLPDSLLIKGMPYEISGMPLYREVRNTFKDAFYSKQHEAWEVCDYEAGSQDGMSLLAHKTSTMLNILNEKVRVRLEEVMNQPSKELSVGEGAKLVGEDTKKIILQGLDFGIQESVLTDQIEDIGRAVEAYTNGSPMFLLANEAGTGKTMVLGGIIRELRKRGATDFAYITQSEDLILQIKRDLKDYGVDDVNFITYAGLSAGRSTINYDTILLTDECHNIENMNSARGRQGQELFAKAKFVVPTSATPFDNPLKMQYLAASGLFESEGFEGFSDWASLFGVNCRKINGVEVFSWRGTPEQGKLARQWMFNRGMMTSRPIKLPPGLVNSNFVNFEADQKWVNFFNSVEKAYDQALVLHREESKAYSDIRMHRENTFKRILEASKLEIGIARAKASMEQGRHPVIFVETKAERHIGKFRMLGAKQKDPLYGYPEMRDMMAEWRQECEMAKMMGDSMPKPPFASFIYEIAGALYDHGIDEILPSTSSEIIRGIGKKNVAVYTGEVANSRASKNLAEWREGKKLAMVATMAKGGTGLSLHDIEGDHPVDQININLPWTAKIVEQVSARAARYGLASIANINWIFASNIPFEARLANVVGKRMQDMGATVKGIDLKAAEVLLNGIDFAGAVDINQVATEANSEVSLRELDMIVKLAADSLDKLRVQDVERVMSEALTASDSTYLAMYHYLSTRIELGVELAAILIENSHYTEDSKVSELAALTKQAMHLESKVDIRNKMFAARSGELTGLELKHSNRDSYVIFLADASNAGKFRVNYFDKDGLLNHKTRSTYEELLESVFKEGYQIEAAGSLERLMVLESFSKGNEAVARIQKANEELAPKPKERLTLHDYMEVASQLAKALVPENKRTYYTKEIAKDLTDIEPGEDPIYTLAIQSTGASGVTTRYETFSLTTGKLANPKKRRSILTGGNVEVQEGWVPPKLVLPELNQEKSATVPPKIQAYLSTAEQLTMAIGGSARNEYYIKDIASYLSDLKSGEDPIYTLAVNNKTQNSSFTTFETYSLTSGELLKSTRNVLKVLKNNSKRRQIIVGTNFEVKGGWIPPKLTLPVVSKQKASKPAPNNETVKVFRGEYGPAAGKGAFTNTQAHNHLPTFTPSLAVAALYANEPNNTQDKVVNSVVTESTIKFSNLLDLTTAEQADSAIDIKKVYEVLGEDKEAIDKCLNSIKNKLEFIGDGEVVELNDLPANLTEFDGYVDVWRLVNQEEFIGLAKALDFDGIKYWGSNPGAITPAGLSNIYQNDMASGFTTSAGDAIEYRPFDQSQIVSTVIVSNDYIAELESPSSDDFSLKMETETERLDREKKMAKAKRDADKLNKADKNVSSGPAPRQADIDSINPEENQDLVEYATKVVAKIDEWLAIAATKRPETEVNNRKTVVQQLKSVREGFYEAATTGEQLNRLPEQKGVLNFLNKCANSINKWPTVEEHDELEARLAVTSSENYEKSKIDGGYVKPVTSIEQVLRDTDSLEKEILKSLAQLEIIKAAMPDFESRVIERFEANRLWRIENGVYDRRYSHMLRDAKSEKPYQMGYFDKYLLTKSDWLQGKNERFVAGRMGWIGKFEKMTLGYEADPTPELTATANAKIAADNANVLSAADYYKTDGARTLAHEAKAGSADAITQMAKEMAPLVPAGAVLVPIPSKDGSATITLEVAKALAELTGRPMADVIKGKSRDSVYDFKFEGNDTDNLKSEFFEFKLEQEPPAGDILLIDNVYDTGTTAKYAANLFSSSQVLVHSRVTTTENVKPYEKPGQKSSERIEDFGEHVAGAAKDRWGKFLTVIKSDFADIAQQPLSKSFPVPQFDKLSKNGVDKKTLAMVALIRASLPPRKPKHRVNLAGWVNDVNTARATVTSLIEDESGNVKTELLESKAFAKQQEMLAVLEGIEPKHYAKASLYKVRNNKFSVMNGVEYPENEKFYYLLDDKGHATYAEAEQDFDQFLPKVIDRITDDVAPSKSADKKSRRRVALKVFQNFETQNFEIGFKGGNGEFTILKDLGKTDKDKALAYLEQNYNELADKLEKMREFTMRSEADTDRVGPQYRTGDVTVEEFSETFGLRAVQWGNSTLASQKEAQEKLNSAYDAFMDMSEIIGISPKAVGLDGSLAIAFGARGKGGVSKGGFSTVAHFEWDEVIINLTRKRGSGSLAHEFWHALDNHVSKQKEYGKDAGGKRYSGHQTEGPFNHTNKKFIDGKWQEVSTLSRVEVITAFEGLHSVINNNKYSTRAKELDSLFSRKEYWAKNSEKSARAFEKYLKDELSAQGYKNDFLANIVDTETGDGLVYPSTEEMANLGIKGAFDDIFETLKERETENKVALYRLDNSYDAVWDQWAGMIASDPDLFRYETIKAADLETIFIEQGYNWDEDRIMLQDFSESPMSEHHGDLKRVYTVNLNRGEQAIVFETEDLVWLDVSGLASGHGNGSRFYQVIADFAHNSGKVFIGDPEGLSELAVVRRTENMMSSALRHGTTKHLGPHLNQLEGINDAGKRMPNVMRMNWSGDNRENLLSLLQTSYNNVRQHIPEIENVEYDFKRSEYRVSGQVPGTDDNAIRLVGFLNESGIKIGQHGSERIFPRRLSPVARALAGSATLQRAIVTQSLLREARVENQRPGVLEDVAELFAAAAENDSLKGILYKAALSPADIAAEIQRHTAKVESWIAETEFNTGVPVKVVPTPSELPVHIRNNIGHGPGVYDIVARKPYIIANRIKNESHAIKTALHEGIGHTGCIAFLKRNEAHGGKAMIDVLDDIYAGIGAEEITRHLGEYNLDLTNLSDRREAVLEYIAILAERGEKPEAVASTVSASKEMMANMYPDLKWSRNDVLQMIDSSRAYMVNERVAEAVSELNPDSQQTPEQYQEAYYSILKDAGGKLESLLKNRSSLVAWHGTPHTIKEFSLEHVGSGEGAQGYGHGLYFAENVAVANSYKESIPKNRVVIKEGIYDLWNIKGALDRDKPELTAVEYFEAAGNDWGKARALLRHDELHANQDTRKVDLYEGVIASDVELAITKLAETIQPLPGGKLYMVSIDADRGHLLDFDTTIDGQSQYVKDRLKPYLSAIDCTPLMEDTLPPWKSEYLDQVAEINGDIAAVSDAIDEIVFEDDSSSSAWGVITQYPVAMDPNDMHDMIESTGRNLIGRPFTGEDVYYELQNSGMALSEEGASNFLKDLGIPGIQYFDGESRLEGEGTHNFVIFDDELITIVPAPAQENKVPANDSVASAWQAAKDQGLDLSQDARMLRARVAGFNTDTVFYHGSQNSFEQFSEDNIAHYFTTNPEYGYIKKSDVNYPVYLKYNNPYMAGSQSDLETLRSNPDRVEELKKKGYDAMAWHKEGDVTASGSGWGNDYPQVAVFSSEQIRSVNATFAMDANAPSILHKLNDEAAVDGPARDLLHFGLPMDADSRLSRARDQGYDTSRVLYHGSMSTFDSLVPQSIASAFGRGVYLTTSPEDASRYASKDVMVNMDIPGKAEHLSATLGISYSEAKAELTAGPGSVTPVFAKVSNPIVIDRKGISLDGRRITTFINQRAQDMARIADIKDPERFLAQLDRIQNGGPRNQILIENLTGNRQANKAVAISALLSSYNAGGFIRELAVTLNANSIILKDGAATVPGKVDTGIEHVISLGGGNDIRSVNAAFNPEYQDLPQLLNKIDGPKDVWQNSFVAAVEKVGFEVQEVGVYSGRIEASLTRDSVFLMITLSDGDLITEELRNEYSGDAGKFSEAYLAGIEVDESARRGGVGSKAMTDLMEALKEVNTDVISLACAFKSLNGFYKSLGFNSGDEIDSMKYQSLSERALFAEKSPVRFLFAGVNAKNANHSMLQQAKDMTTDRETIGEIWRQTGWAKGVDNKWRFEIDDSKMQMPDDLFSRLNTSLSRLGSYTKHFSEAEQDGMEFELLKTRLVNVVNHNDLFMQYPALMDLEVIFKSKPGSGIGASMSDGYRLLSVYINSEEEINSESIGSRILHEIQHSIQNTEVFAEGGNTNHSFVQYLRRSLVDAHHENYNYVEAIKYENITEESHRLNLITQFSNFCEYSTRDSITRQSNLIYHSDTYTLNCRDTIDVLGMPPKPRKVAEHRSWLQAAAGHLAFIVSNEFRDKFNEDIRDVRDQLIKEKGPNAVKNRRIVLSKQRSKILPEVLANQELDKLLKDTKTNQINTPSKRKELYKSLAGEVEARNVQARRNLQPGMRDDMPPEVTEDVSRRKQVVYSSQSSSVAVGALETNSSYALRENELTTKTEKPDLNMRLGLNNLNVRDRAQELGLGHCNIVVVAKEDDLPLVIRKASIEHGGQPVVAANHGQTMYMVAENINTKAELTEALLHEASHQGMESVFGKDMAIAYTRFWTAIGQYKGMESEAEKNGFSMVNYKNAADKMLNTGKLTVHGRTEMLVDEFIAHANERKEKQTLTGKCKRLTQEFIGSVRNSMMKHGWVSRLKMNSSDLAFTIKQVNDAARGQQVDVPQILRENSNLDGAAKWKWEKGVVTNYAAINGCSVDEAIIQAGAPACHDRLQKLHDAGISEHLAAIGLMDRSALASKEQVSDALNHFESSFSWVSSKNELAANVYAIMEGRLGNLSSKGEVRFSDLGLELMNAEFEMNSAITDQGLSEHAPKVESMRFQNEVESRDAIEEANSPSM